MRRRTVALVLVATLGGCVSYPASRSTAKVGGYMVLASLAIAVPTLFVLSHRHGNDESAPINVLIFDSLVLEAGAIAGVSGLLGMLIHDKPEPEPLPAPEPPPDPSVLGRRRVMDLAKQAVAAGYANDCAAVKQRDAEIRAIDPEFHATVFVHYAKIKTCLDAEPPAVSPPPEPAVAPITPEPTP
jgi:hypothetical protein